MYESAKAARRFSAPPAVAARALGAFVAIAAIAWCSGCAGDTNRGGDAGNDNARGETLAESPAVEDHGERDDEIPVPPVAADERHGATTSEYDWDSVSSVGTIRGTRVLMGLLRHLDIHHEDSPQTIRVTWREPGNAVDDFGRTLPTFAEEWKGMVEAIVTRAQRDEDGISRWRAMPSQMYTDGFGEVTRHNYRVFIESDDRLRFENDGPVQ